MSELIRCTNVCKDYHRGAQSVRVLDNVDFSVEDGAFVRGRWFPIRACWSAMSRPAISTEQRLMRSWRCFRRCIESSARPSSW